MAIQQIDQGILNRIKATVVYAQFAALNVNPPNLGREGIRLTLDTNATDYFPTMTGAVPSPAPYQVCTLTLNLLKTQTLGQLYQQQFLNTTLVGQITVYPDVQQGGYAGSSNIPIGVYFLQNCVLESVNAMTFSGEEPLFVVTVKGYILINSTFFT